MRVLLISHTCQSPTEGQPKVVALAENTDLNLEVVVPKRWKHYGRWRPLEVLPEAQAWIKPHRVRLPWAGPAQHYLHCYPDLAKTIKRFKPDVIDLWEEPWGLVSVQAARLRNRFAPHAALLSETEQNIEKSLPCPFEHFRRFTFRQADWLVGRSREAVSVARRKGYDGSATVLPNAVDTELFTPADRRSCRIQCQLPTDAVVLGYVGRLVQEKGLQDLLEALRHLPERFHAALVGSGPARPDLESYARDAGLGERVHWIGRKPLHELPLWMNSFDALVLPSRTTASWKEQFGRVLIEAESCGIPSLGSTSGAIPDVIEDNRRIFEEANPQDLAACVQRMAYDKTWATHDTSQRLRRRVVNRFSWTSVATDYLNVYRQAIEARSQ